MPLGKDLLKQLTPEQYENWCKEVEKDQKLSEEIYDRFYHLNNTFFADLETLLMCSFMWRKTDQGYDYWNSVTSGF